MSKSISKSVRLTAETYNFIDRYTGEGFNQKLENLVMDMLVTEERLKARLSDLEKRIQERQELLDKLSKDYEVFSRVRRDATYLEKQFAGLSKCVESLIASRKEVD